MTKKIRHHQLLRYVNHYTSHLWARRIIPSLLLAGQKAREYNRLQKLDTGYLQVGEQTAATLAHRFLCVSKSRTLFTILAILQGYTLHLERFVHDVALICYLRYCRVTL